MHSQQTPGGGKNDGSDDDPGNGRRGDGANHPTWRLAIASFCVLVWAADNLRGVVEIGYQPHVAAAVPLAAATYIFGTVLFPRRKD